MKTSRFEIFVLPTRQSLRFLSGNSDEMTACFENNNKSIRPTHYFRASPRVKIEKRERKPCERLRRRTGIKGRVMRPSRGHVYVEMTGTDAKRTFCVVNDGGKIRFVDVLIERRDVRPRPFSVWSAERVKPSR